MKYILALIAALVSARTLAMDLGQVEATIQSCRNGVVCSCPPARISLVDLIKNCGRGPDIKLDQDSNFSNRKEFEAWGKCGKEVDAANDAIRRYNAIFDHCQHPYSKSEDVRRPLANQPHISTGTPDSDKTLAEQEAEAKQQDPDDIDRLQAEAERRARAQEAKDRIERQSLAGPSTQSPQETDSQPPGLTCFRNSRYGMNVVVDPLYPSSDFFLVCLDQNKSVHWANGTLGKAPNGDDLAIAGPNEFNQLMRSCAKTPVEYSCPECCQPIH
jgi:hypothetical protein